MVDNAIILFKEQMGLGINYQSIASDLGYSVAHLRRLFHKVLGKGPKIIFQQIRMQEAQRMKVESDKTMTEIGVLLGFSSLSAFSRAYGQYFKQLGSS